MTELKDILYFDFEKAASLISQTEGGLSKEKTEQKESSSDQKDIRKYDLLKVFKAEFGGIEAEKQSVLETKVLHHDLLARLEDFLFKSEFAVDMNLVGARNTLSETRIQFEDTPYLRAEGWCAIEDFDRIYEMTQKFNDILSFVKRSEVEGEFDKTELLTRLEELDLEGKTNTKEFRDLISKKKDIDKYVDKRIKWSKLPDELFEGIRNWIDTLARHRLNLRMVPFPEFKELQVIANLKRECFADENLDHLLFGYGSQPNIKLSVFGLVTSVPCEDSEAEYNIYEGDNSSENNNYDAGDNDLENVENFERAFRALFPAIRGMEKFTSFHHYPRIVVHPIAVYRTIRQQNAEET